ncbi:MAG: adenylosuccinate lyase [Calditrichaeota bacterium]|nr:MAG: adenylosuccinate lyase [Calditrichota bacterium]MBL1206923.1 adenylosuccinate lyase [Calditrichota bacterium]NOG46750.1 adenylosuccinate lyase [Calditrichota bacterium]
MIARYSLPEIEKIWTDEERFSIWLEIEIAASEANNQLGIVPDEDLKTIKEKANFKTNRILEIEAEVKHDVIAFLTNVAEYVGPPARYIHYGLTSSDVLDTALAVQLVRAGKLISDALEALIKTIGKRAVEFKNTIQMGRSHGIHAEPITFGLKLAVWYDELKRQRERLKEAVESIRVGQISGAVGTYDHLDPQVQDYVCLKLGLKSANISTQVLQRDRHAHYMSALALIGATIEKIAVEIRHLQRTEVLEAEEGFTKGQKGSSAMPHKKNPIISEQLSGMARLLRGNAHTAMENVALWHERDISHSSVERIIMPDSTMLLYYMLKKANGLIANLNVFPENMMANLQKTNGLFSSQVVLLALTQKGVSREKAYRMVQRNAMKVWEEKEDFAKLLKADPDLKEALSAEEIDDLCSIEKRLSKVDYIFNKVGLK